MPKYFFNVRNHIDTEDQEGVELADLDAAMMEAQKDIVDIMKSQAKDPGARWPEWSIEICDSRQKVLMVMPFLKS